MEQTGADTATPDTLPRITAAIADAVTAEQVYAAVVDQVADAAGASSAGLWIVDEDGAVARLVRSTGYQPEAMAALETLSLERGGQIPLLDAIRSGVPLFISSQAELLRRYPHLEALTTRSREYHMACIPLTVQGRALGGFAFTFEQRDASQGERDALTTLAGRYCAQALERLRLLEAERKSRSDAEALAHRMGVLSAASRTFAEVGPETGALLQSVAELVCSTYADACYVHLLVGADEPPIAAAFHRRPEQRDTFRQMATARGLQLGQGLSGRVASTGQPILMPRVVPEQILEVVLPEVREAYARSMPRSLAVVPLRSRGKIIGALAAQRDQHPRDFGEADVELLQELAERAALAIENGRLYQDNERGRARAEILAGLAGAVNQAKTLEEVLEAAQLALGSATNAPRSAILLFDGEGVMRFRAWRGLSDEYRRAVDGHSPWSRDAQSPAPILVPDVRHDEAMAPLLPVFEREGIGSVGFIPLVAGRQLVGKFMVYFDGPHTFSAEEREMTAAIATHVAAGTARFASVEELQRTVHFNEMFTAMLGHDLRNPLAAMMMAAQVMLKREDTKALAKPLGRIVSSGNRMTRMIDQLLDFTRVRIGTGIPIRPKPTDVRVLVRQVLGELEDSQAPRAVNVESRGDSRGSWDGDRLAQVFSNLAANAIHYGDPEQPVDVVLDGSAPEQMVVSIHNGGAMEPALVAQLFEPMAGRDRRSGKSRGLGLGLFISRQMVLAHGGEIVVDSHPERGTTLTVTLPRPADFAP